MSEKINRRSFMKRSAALGVTSVLSSSILPAYVIGNKPLDISVVQGDNYEKNTIKAVENLGGMEKFLPQNSKVAILANPQRNNPGAYTKPEVLKAVIKMCKQAGAIEICCISWLPEKNWVSTGLKKVIDEQGTELKITDRKNEELFKPVSVPKGKELKEARIVNTFFDYDIFINIPITKDHAGNKFTGTMKNLMGLNSPANNRTFHKKDWATNPANIAFLDQCIADLNTIFKPDLCIVDATEFIITNGPFGPGELFKPKKVVAGVDRVAIDAYCSTLWGLNPKDILMIKNAYDHGIGEINLSNVKINEAVI
ncbi:MAG: DUF362 domain-containing protein [Calditrichia bacterium]|nr:DUF362 domain-containing protein [Calditrichia bacterium]